VTSEFSGEGPAALRSPPEGLGDESFEEPCGDDRKDHGRSPEGHPSGRVPCQRVLRGAREFGTRAIYDDLPAADAESEADDVADPAVEFPMLIGCAVCAADRCVKKPQPLRSPIITSEECLAKVRGTEVL